MYNSFKDIYENSPDMYVSVSPKDGSILMCNETFLRSTGNIKKEIIGAPIFSVYHEDCMNEAIKTFNQFVDIGIVKNKELILKKKNGGKMYVTLNVNAVRDKKGNILYSISSWRDNTEIYEVREALLESEEKFKKMNDDKDRFIQILAHDLRSPLNSIIGFLDLLTQNIREYNTDKIEEFLNIINNSAKYTFNLLEDILLWGRANSGKILFEPQKLNFVTICNEVVETLKLTANIKEIEINQCSSNEVNVFADKNMLNIVLQNLISNAIKFTNKGGQIDIYAEANYEIVTITISDNGVGINPDTANKLFDISHKITTQGTANEKGTGLGLLLCKEFVEKQGGKIWVESKLGKGSCFKFTLLLYKDL